MHSQIGKVLLSCTILIILSGVPQATASEAEMLAAMDGMMEAINTHDPGMMSSFWTDDIEYDFVAQPPILNGKPEVAALFESVFHGAPDFHRTNTNILVSGNIMVTEAVATGTHLGEILGIPATGNKLHLAPLHIWEFEGDKIKRATEYLDIASMFIQMGLMPAPELDPALLVPSFPLPEPEPTGLAPIDAALELDALYDAHDVFNYSRRIHPDAEIILVPLGVPLSREAFISVLELYFMGFPDLNQEIIRSFEFDDGWVALEAVWLGMNDGPYFGMPATRRYSEVRGAWTARFDADGLLTNLSVYFDNITILANLGLFPPPEPEANKAVIEHWLELWNTRNLVIADEIFAPDFVPHTPHFPDLVDIDSYKTEIINTGKTVPDFQANLEDIIAEGDKVVARFTATGTAQGEIMGVPVDNVPYTNTWIIMFRFVNGRIAEEWWQFDMLGVMEQWGMMPPSRPTPESYTWGPPSEVTGDPGDPVTNTASVLYFVQKFWNEHSVSALDNTHRLDFIVHNPTIPVSPEFYMYKQVCLLYLAAFPDFRVTTHNIIAEGDKVAVYWTVNGTHLGELMGIPPTGRPVEFTGATIHRFADGKIVENWWAYDALGMMQQITAPPEN